MARYTNNITIFSSNGKFEEEMKKLYKEHIESLTFDKNTENVQTFILAERIGKNTDYTHSDILKDYGNGRISSGLKSLELISILCSGVSYQDLFLFDRVVYTGNVYNFKNSSDTELLVLVLSNLGMVQYIESLPSNITKEYIDICLKIGKHVKDGTFNLTSYKNYFIKESKKIVKLYLELV